MNKEPNDKIKKTAILNTAHVRQRYKWDCGLACVSMVISEEDRNIFWCNFTTICHNKNIYESTWTIDLCYLLKRFNVTHCMYTKKYGINRQHNVGIKISEKDIQRVRKRFEEASSCGLKIIEKTLITEDLMSYVASHGPAIVLVNARLLSCDWCKRNKLSSELSYIWGGAYHGHYVTIIGQVHHKILYRDPASRHHTCATTARKLDAARSTPGTDHDVILINK